MRRFLRLALIKRFFISVREEGLGPALQKVRNYLILQWHGRAPGVITVGGALSPEHYLLGTWSEIAKGGGFHVRRRLVGAPRLALIGDLNLAQCRKYRIEQFAEFWERQGIVCEYSHYQDIPRCTRIMQGATHLMEYRLQSMPITEMYRYEARRLGLPILYDIDDPLFSVSAYETYGNMDTLDPGLKAHFVAEAPKYAAMMNGADILSFSTPGLAAHAALYSTRPAYVRRNFADATTLADGQKARAAKPSYECFTVVYASGSQGHEADFEVIAPQLEAFLAADPTRRLMILGHFRLEMLNKPTRLQTVHHSFLPYSQYLEMLAASDVAVMPLLDDTFNQCKSAVRVIDAASVSIPAVVSAVGDLPEAVEEGKTGYVAKDPKDWSRILEALASDRTRTTAMGAAARLRLEEHWSAQAKDHIIAPEILDWVHR